jgi:hypothetical protein
MTATPYGWGPLNAADSLPAAGWSTTLLSLANGASSVSISIDNTALPAFTEAALLIDLGAATTVGSSGNPGVQAVPLDAIDGSNYMPTFVSGGTLYPLDRQRGQTFPASTSVRFILIRDLFLSPALCKIAIINNLGVAFPSSGVAAWLYRMRGQSGS